MAAKSTTDYQTINCPMVTWTFLNIAKLIRKQFLYGKQSEALKEMKIFRKGKQTYRGELNGDNRNLPP